MVMNMILVWMVSRCNAYVIPESIRRKDLGYESRDQPLLIHAVVSRSELASEQRGSAADDAEVVQTSKRVGSRRPALFTSVIIDPVAREGQASDWDAKRMLRRRE